MANSKQVAEAKSERGHNVMETVGRRQLVEACCRSGFTTEVSIVELAQRRAELARASVLLQFPRGWPDILNTSGRR